MMHGSFEPFDEGRHMSWEPLGDEDDDWDDELGFLSPYYDNEEDADDYFDWEIESDDEDEEESE